MKRVGDDRSSGTALILGSIFINEFPDSRNIWLNGKECGKRKILNIFYWVLEKVHE